MGSLDRFFCKGMSTLSALIVVLRRFTVCSEPSIGPFFHKKKSFLVDKQKHLRLNLKCLSRTVDIVAEFKAVI